MEQMETNEEAPNISDPTSSDLKIDTIRMQQTRTSIAQWRRSTSGAGPSTSTLSDITQMKEQILRNCVRPQFNWRARLEQIRSSRGTINDQKNLRDSGTAAGHASTCNSPILPLMSVNLQTPIRQTENIANRTRNPQASNVMNRRMTGRTPSQRNVENAIRMPFGHTQNRVNANNDTAHKPQTNFNRNKNRPIRDSFQHDRERTERKFHVGFKKLEEWSEKEPDALIVQLIGQQMGFEDLLETRMSPDTLVLVLRVLGKLCSSPFIENKTEIMMMASKENFLNSLLIYVVMLPHADYMEKKKNPYFWNDPSGFFMNVATVFKSLIETIPTRACEALPKILKPTIAMFTLFEEGQEKIPEEIKMRFKKIEENLDLTRTHLERRKKQRLEMEDEGEPPEDFRELTVYPTSEEILTADHGFLRKHIIKGPYNDVDHYLDVQFRLLKEDFVAPLRNGVHEYLQVTHIRSKVSKFSNVRIHPLVTFLNPYYGKNEGGVLLQFELPKKGKNIPENRRFYKRFIYGSLLCFTDDNFATVLFGKIVERTPELLSKGQIVVDIDHDQDIHYNLNKPYLMVECSVYFEPYYHVLKALQHINEDTFPMRNYFIDVNKYIQPAGYLQHDTVYEIKGHEIILSEETSWPDADTLNLDDTQYIAFIAALTNKFVVIQGPPGTGKTYLGLEVVKTLLTNSHAWYTRTPILVVCYTNHALDQFLEGLTDTTDKIVRIGGQSKSTKLEMFSLKEQRRKTARRREVNDVLYDTRRELEYYLAQIKEFSTTINQLRQYDGVFSFKMFSSVEDMPKDSWFRKAADKDILEWLLGGRTAQQQRQELFQMRIEQMRKDDENAKANQTMEMVLDAFLHGDGKNTNGSMSDFDTILASLFELSINRIYITTVADMTKQLYEMVSKLEDIRDNNQQEVFNRRWELERSIYKMHDELEYLKVRLNEGANSRGTEALPEDIDLNRPFNIAPVDRWKLYFHFLRAYEAQLVNEIVHLENSRKATYKRYNELRTIDDTAVMKQMLVVGMTTTGAARLQSSLQAVKSRIVIVEEAAEVLESHIVVSLTNHCEHLILIGDHKQLRPSTANFKMETKYNLGISLFERMVINDIQCHVLGVQHRMRPEIAKLIVPSVYPKLINHESVYNYPQIGGIKHCLYFIDHNEPEEESGDSSKMNMHEAQFLMRLARYLIQNGYEPEDITILATYSGQMFSLWKERQNYDLLLRDVRITVLDNYQGEESKIILLSLVRSNEEGKIGFLKIENRVCVALSRAKEGFYMMGNMNLLSEASQIWPKVKQALESQNCLGKSLSLQCQVHRDQITMVTSANDFDKVPEGGCSKVCGVLMKCGHECLSICHIQDRAHDKPQCKAPCSRYLCEKNHECPKRCFEECGACQVPMMRMLRCGHTATIACHVNPEEYKCRAHTTAKLPCEHEVTNKPCYVDGEMHRCPFPCDTRVEPCGHACELGCHIKNDPDHLEYKCRKQCVHPQKGCSTGDHMCPLSCYEECLPCLIIVKKKRTVCTHVFDVACNVDAETVNCMKPCKKMLPCGHHCKKRCNEPCGDCQILVDKVHPACGQKVKTKCCEEPTSQMCTGPCPLILPCGHPCKNKCKQECTKRCPELVEHKNIAQCGHNFKISCYLQGEGLPSNDAHLLTFCDIPCGEKLSCKHICTGTCGQCYQGRVHIKCKEKCGVPLICGHECTIPCRDGCMPCTRKCSYKCKHSVCRKTCGEPCTPCKEKCTRSCRHVKCPAPCGNICTVAPCDEPCMKLLKCRHPCVGFCGEPCPPLCRVCDAEELTEILFGGEDEEDARFVLLEECGHVIESQGMETWLNQDGSAINYKSCPKCKTPLSFTQRFSDSIKRTLQDVTAVKKKSYGNFRDNNVIQQNLNKRLENVKMDRLEETKLLDTVMKLRRDLSHKQKNRRNPLNKMAARIYTAKIQIVENIVQSYNMAEFKHQSHGNSVRIHIDFILGFLLQHQQITNQEIDDLQLELMRLRRIVQLCQIEASKLFGNILSNPSSKARYLETKDLVFSAKKYVGMDDALKGLLVMLANELNTAIITEKERIEIVHAIGLSKGHWYKCRNGHIYAIADCGGASQIGRCNECGEGIGGTNHRLLPGNSHAGEMDGSRHAAWSDTANNMLNFAEFQN